MQKTVFTLLAAFLLSSFTYTSTSTHVSAKTHMNETIEKVVGMELYNLHAQQLYDNLKLESKGLSEKTFKQALVGYYNLKYNGETVKDILSIADFSRSSNEERFYVIDMKANKLLYNTLVAHGRNSGNVFAKHFSNTPESYQSSLGFYVTDKTYYGKHGKSLRLQGKEDGINDNAMRRAIVIHGADYVSQDFISRIGRLGRSFGCPSLPNAISGEIIDFIKDGSVLYIHANNTNYQNSSSYLNVANAVAQFNKEADSQLAMTR